MANDIADFTWLIAQAGHQWIDSETAPGFGSPLRARFLTNSVPVAVAAPLKRYTPLRMFPGLFREFGLEMEQTLEGVKRFADAYGLLGISSAILLRQPDGSKVLGTGEMLDSWLSEAMLMKYLVTLWDAVQKRDLRFLQLHIRWNEDTVVYDSHPTLPTSSPPPRGQSRLIWSASRREHSEMFERFAPNDLVMPALCCLQIKVNETLNKHEVRARLLWDRNFSELVVRLVPKNLVGCLWLQLAKAIEGHKDYRQCENCRLWFEVGGARAARSDKRFCSPSCKASAHRRKKEQALEMANAGISAKEIAAKLETNLATVKGWMKK